MEGSTTRLLLLLFLLFFFLGQENNKEKFAQKKKGERNGTQPPSSSSEATRQPSRDHGDRNVVSYLAEEAIDSTDQKRKQNWCRTQVSLGWISRRGKKTKFAVSFPDRENSIAVRGGKKGEIKKVAFSVLS